MDIKNIDDESESNTLLKYSSIAEKEDINLNGLFIKKIYIPKEVLLEILCRVDHKQLLLCHLVCKQWNTLIKKYVWWKKAGLICGQSFPAEDKIPWTSYYFVCDKKPFNKNLLLSPHTEVHNAEEFTLTEFNRNDNPPPINVLPFPEDPAFANKITCITSPNSRYVAEKRKLIIDLRKEGFTDHTLDYLQPTIKINEWFCCKWDQEDANYQCSIKLLKTNDDDGYHKIMRVFHFDKNLKEVNQKGQWLKFTYEFKNYGKGLRIIKFYDGGKNNVILAGASVKLVMPNHDFNNTNKN